MIQAILRQAAVVLLGFETPGEGFEVPFFEAMKRLAGDLKRVVFTDSAGVMELET